MIFIILAVLVVVICAAIGIYYAVQDDEVKTGFYGVIAGLLTSAFILGCGCCIPSKEYYDPEIEYETEIVSLSNSVVSEGDGALFYVSVDAGNVYSYRVEVESEYAEDKATSYEVRTIGSDKKVIEVETKDGSTPKLVKYVKKGKMSFWALGDSKVTYVFYVPEGSISRTINLT